MGRPWSRHHGTRVCPCFHSRLYCASASPRKAPLRFAGRLGSITLVWHRRLAGEIVTICWDGFHSLSPSAFRHDFLSSMTLCASASPREASLRLAGRLGSITLRTTPLVRYSVGRGHNLEAGRFSGHSQRADRPVVFRLVYGFSLTRLLAALLTYSLACASGW